MSKYNYSSRKLIKLLKKHNFFLVRQSGSHAIFKNFNNNRKVIIPIHSKDIPNGTAKAILKDAGIDV